MDAMQPFSEGQWVRWTTESQSKQGQVITIVGVSFIVRWLDGSEQVFPVAEYARASMEIIERPREASRIERDRRKGVMSISRAAATLGTTPKRVRAMLREGKLEGEQRDGKWISVELDG